ncbi:hypothetical protein AB0K37_41415, partial [Actinomadura sp. NPDC049753]
MIAPEDEPGGRGRPPDRRPDASMSLLADLFAGRRLDPGYAEAAARRAASGGAGTRPRGLRGAGVLLVLALTGALAAVAGVEVHRSEPVAAERHSELVALAQLHDIAAKMVALRDDHLAGGLVVREFEQ